MNRFCNGWSERVERLEAEKKELLEACRMALTVLLQNNDYDDYTTRTITDLQLAIRKAT